jgi:hypothetical protein
MNSTIVGLVAAIAVLSGGLGFSMTGIFDDQNLMTSNLLPATGFLMGQVEIEARNSDGEIIAYRLSDNEVVDDGEQCILKMLFATTEASGDRGGYASSGMGACSGVLTGAWNVIAIGDNNDTVPFTSASHAQPTTLAIQDLNVKLGNETSSVSGLKRGMATSITWHNGTGDSVTKIVLAKTFTAGTLHAGHAGYPIGESALFNSTTAGSEGMLARQTFTDVTLGSGDSITVTWTFTVGN